MAIEIITHGTEEFFSEGIKPGTNYDAWRIQPQQTLNKLPWHEAALHIVNWGILAPSAHNKQPWLVHLNHADRTMTVKVDQEVIGTASDKSGRQAHIGLGCFVENTSLALQGYGLPADAQIRLHNRYPFVEFHLGDLNSGELITPEIFHSIIKRRSYRGPFDRSYKISDEIKSNLVEVGRMEDGVDILWLFSDNRKQNILKNSVLARIQRTANAAVLHIEPFRKELADHFGKNDSSKSRVMPGDTFGLADRDAKELVNELGQGKISPQKAAGIINQDMTAVKTAQVVGIMHVDSDDPVHWIKAGRTLQRVWLTSQNSGLGLGVMAGIAEVAAQKTELLRKIGDLNTPVSVFRIGKPKLDWPHSPRVEPEEIIELMS